MSQHLTQPALVLPCLQMKHWGIEPRTPKMEKTIRILKKLGLGCVRKAEEDTPFEKRLKKVSRIRVVNQQGLGGPVFKNRQPETEA